MKRIITASVCLLLLVAAVTCGHKNERESWVARYNGPGNGTDAARFIAVDNSGNVYVTGFSEGLDSTFDYATIKYDSLGNQLWVTRYDGPGNRGDGANSLLVDNSGNVYVTGVSKGSALLGADMDYATIKYDSSGNQLWVARYDGGGSEDKVYSMAVDNSGNVYVTGQTGYRLPDSSWNCDYGTVKYDSSGNQLWAVRYDGPGNHMDGARSIAVDNAGNVYVTGGSDVSITNSDYATIKYGPDGQ